MLFGGSNQMLVCCNRPVSKSGAWLHFRRECGDGGTQDSRNGVWELILSRKVGQYGTEGSRGQPGWEKLPAEGKGYGQRRQPAETKASSRQDRPRSPSSVRAISISTTSPSCWNQFCLDLARWLVSYTNWLCRRHFTSLDKHCTLWVGKWSPERVSNMPKP